MQTQDEIYERLRERYESGQVPWDAELPPPEVLAQAAAMTPGRALDLGCGYGRATIYLAKQGWQVDGVDFVETAVAEATQRAAAAGVADRATFHHSPVTHMPFLTGPYDWIIDVGCMHSFAISDARRYRDEVQRLLAPGGLYLLFAHLRNDANDDAAELRWIPERDIAALFDDGFALANVEHGWTQVEDKPAWRSGWFWFRRLG